MDFFNKLTKKAKETCIGASKKTGELAKEAKLRMKMNENKSEINSLYQEIGKKVYEKHITSGEIDIKTELEDECTQIDILSAEIETCLNQIRELKDKKQCPNCFNEIDLDAKFCNHCGVKQEETKTSEVEIIDMQNTENDADEKIVETSDIEEDISIVENSQQEEQNNTGMSHIEVDVQDESENENNSN